MRNFIILVILAAGIIWFMNRPVDIEQTPLGSTETEDAIESTSPESDFDPNFIDNLDPEQNITKDEAAPKDQTSAQKIDTAIAELEILLEEFSGSEFEFNDDLES
jgi:hypothetical protein